MPNANYMHNDFGRKDQKNIERKMRKMLDNNHKSRWDWT